MKPSRLFTEHPESVGQTYGQHFRFACGFATRMLLGGTACLFHAFFPFAFRHTGSTCITDLYERLIASRSSANARARMSAVR